MSEKNALQPVNGAVMEIGGGIAGMKSAPDLAGSGDYAYPVGKEPSIGGAMAHVEKSPLANRCVS